MNKKHEKSMDSPDIYFFEYISLYIHTCLKRHEIYYNRNFFYRNPMNIFLCFVRRVDSHRARSKSKYEVVEKRRRL